MEKLREPDFFIIGAPKCGTTALATYLNSNRDILISEPKEPNFFNTDFSDDFGLFNSYEDYLKTCFRNNHKIKMAGEASIWYLFSEVAVSNILKRFPDAKFIVILRNPVDMIYSLYSELLYQGVEDAKTFKEAWNLRKLRWEDERVPDECVDPKVLWYGRVASFGEQLERLYSEVDPDNVKVILNTELNKKTLETYKSTLKFLGVKYYGFKDFSKVNANKRVKSPLLLKISRKLSSKKLTRVKRKLGISANYSLLNMVKNANTKFEKRKPLSVEFRKELVDFFISDIEKTEKILNRDLSHWKR